jgi:hypothetical protein
MGCPKHIEDRLNQISIGQAPESFKAAYRDVLLAIASESTRAPADALAGADELWYRVHRDWERSLAKEGWHQAIAEANRQWFESPEFAGFTDDVHSGLQILGRLYNLEASTARAGAAAAIDRVTRAIERKYGPEHIYVRTPDPAMTIGKNPDHPGVVALIIGGDEEGTRPA